MADDDVKARAVKAEDDYYELLGVSEAVAFDEIRRAYRKTALKYHPDKVGADEEAARKFHLLQIAYDILSDGDARALYDNTRKARADQKAREAAYSDRTRRFADDLKKREAEYLKRKRGEAEERTAAELELDRLAEDSKRRRKEYDERRHKEMADAVEMMNDNVNASITTSSNQAVSDTDRTIKLRYCQEDKLQDIAKDQLKSVFERFGTIEAIVTREKKIKVEGEKHRRTFVVVMLCFQSILGAQALVSNFAQLKRTEPEVFGAYEEANWAGGRVPDCISSQARPMARPVANNNTTYKKQSDVERIPSSWDASLARLKHLRQQRSEEKGSTAAADRLNTDTPSDLPDGHAANVVEPPGHDANGQ